MNQKDLIKYGLLAIGAYLIWKYVQDHGGLDSIFGTVTAGSGDAAAKKAIAEAAAAKAALAAEAARANPNDAAAAAAAKKLSDDAAAAKAVSDKARADDIIAHQKMLDAAAAASAPTGICTQPNFFNKDGVCVWGTVDAKYGTPVPGMKAQPVLTTPDKVANAAFGAGAGTMLSMDQWCYYAGQVGVTCPDPGSIDPAIYEGAWYPGTDRSTPIDINTWWEIVKLVQPGLSGLGSVGWGFSKPVSVWLM